MPSSIYVVENLVNGKKYVGYTSQLPSKRWAEHIRQSRRGTDKLLYRAIRKYGVEKFSFSVVFETDDAFFAQNVMEAQLIRSLGTHASLGRGYNATWGGEGTSGLGRFGDRGSFWGKTHSEEARAKMSEKARGRVPSDAARENMSKAQKGRKWSESHRESMMKSLKNNYEIISPNGEVFTSRSLTAFAKENGLQQSELSRVANGKLRHTHGYTVRRLP